MEIEITEIKNAYQTIYPVMSNGSPSKIDEEQSDVTIINKTIYDFFILALCQAGSSQINTSTTGQSQIWTSGSQYKLETYSLAGPAGNDIEIYQDDKLCDFISGGGGNVAGLVVNQQYWNHYVKRDDSGGLIYDKWVNDGGNYTYQSHLIQRKGQVKIIPFVFYKDSKIRVKFKSHDANVVAEKQGYVEFKPFIWAKDAYPNIDITTNLVNK